MAVLCREVLQRLGLSFPVHFAMRLSLTYLYTPLKLPLQIPVRLRLVEVDLRDALV